MARKTGVSIDGVNHTLTEIKCVSKFYYYTDDNGDEHKFGVPLDKMIIGMSLEVNNRKYKILW